MHAHMLADECSEATIQCKTTGLWADGRSDLLLNVTSTGWDDRSAHVECVVVLRPGTDTEFDVDDVQIEAEPVANLTCNELQAPTEICLGISGFQIECLPMHLPDDGGSALRAGHAFSGQSYGAVGVALPGNSSSMSDGSSACVPA